MPTCKLKAILTGRSKIKTHSTPLATEFVSRIYDLYVYMFLTSGENIAAFNIASTCMKGWAPN